MRGLFSWTSTFNCRLGIVVAFAAVCFIAESTPVFHSSACGQNRNQAAQNEGAAKARRPSRAWRKDSTASRMKRLNSAMELVTLGGIPVIGEIPRGLPNNPGLQLFADRLTLYVRPEILRPEVRLEGVDIRAMATRLLGSTTTKPYVTQDGKGWRGADEFQRKRNKEAFYRDLVKLLNKLSLKPPFRFRTIGKAGVGQYDFAREQFEINWEGNQKAGVLPLSFAGTKQNKLLSELALPQSLTFPKYWKMKPSKAEQLAALLRKVDPRNRNVYVSTIFDVIDNSDPESQLNDGAQWGARFGIRPRHNAVFADIECKNMLWEFPLVLPPAGILATREIVVPRAEPLYLWQTEVQVALAASVNAEAVGRADWLSAALSVFQDDMEYYRFGTMIPRQIQGSDRARMLSSVRSPNQPGRNAGVWDDSYLPFFPMGFFGEGKIDVAKISKRSIRSSQLKLFQRWMASRIDAAAGEFRVEGQIRVDRQNNSASLIPGSSTKDLLAIDFPSRQELGHIGELKHPASPNVTRAKQASGFSVAYPALAYHMNFPVDEADLPATKVKENVQTYAGDLVVKLGDIQWLGSEGNPQVLLHIDPIRFEAFHRPAEGITGNTRVSDVTKIAFSLPVKMASYTGLDLLRDQAAAKALEVAKQAKIEQQRISEQEALREKQKAEVAARRDAEAKAQQVRSQTREREIARRQQERGKIDQKRADALLQHQLEMEQARNQGKSASDVISRQSNELLQQGFTHQQIDWETGTLRPETAQAQQQIRTWPLLLALLTAFVGLMGVVGWRWHRGSLRNDVRRLKEQVFENGHGSKPKSLSKRLAKIDIPKAKKRLGKAMYHQGIGEEEFSGIYRELRQIYSQLAKLQSEQPTNQSTDLGDSSSENALATYYRTSQGMALELQNQLAESKLKSRRRAAFTFLADRLLENPKLDPRCQFERQIENIRMMYDQMENPD